MDKSPVWSFKPELAGQMGRLATRQTRALLLLLISCMKTKEFLKKSILQDLKAHQQELQTWNFPVRMMAPKLCD